MLSLTRIILYITAIGGFLLSMYLLPLVLTYTCESLTYSTASCLFRAGSIMVLHFFIPIYFIFSFNYKRKYCMIALLLYGICMGFMFNYTGWISLILGLYFLFSAVYFLAYKQDKTSA